MKKALPILALLLSLVGHSQSGFKHINLDAGINLNGNNNYNLALEFNKGSMDAWEISVQYHNTPYVSLDSITIGNTLIKELASINKKEEIFLAGVYYKPLLLKSKNLVFNFRYGLLLGTDKAFLMAAGAGFELTYHFSSLFGIYLRQSNHYIINVNQRFRHAINIGVKIPL